MLRIPFSALALAFVALLATPALAALDQMPATGVLELATPAAAECVAPAPHAYAVERLFVEATDLALCDTELLATGLCLEPVDFGPIGSGAATGVLLGIRQLGCSATGRSPPG